MNRQAEKEEPCFRVTGPRPRKLEVARWLRKHPTVDERWVWEQLRGKRMFGLKFRRQQPIRGFVADFYCASLGLVLELDGTIHQEPQQQAHDARRRQVFESIGLIELRLSSAVISRPNLVHKIRHALLRRGHHPPFLPRLHRSPPP